MQSAILFITLAICSIALGLPSGVPRTSRVLNHEPMTEEKLQDLVKLHMAGVSVDLKHNDPVVSGSFFLNSSVLLFFSLFLFSFFFFHPLSSRHSLGLCKTDNTTVGIYVTDETVTS